jgi:hypothetical protein
VPIHADVETHTVTVRNSTIAVLKAFFGSV